MAGFYVVVDDLNDWSPYFPSRDVISFDQYLALRETEPRVRVINCCRNARVLGRGYYCSLLATARGHNVIPTVRVINDLRRKALWSMQLEKVEKALGQLSLPEFQERGSYLLRIFFGRCRETELEVLAKHLFERFPAPMLEAELTYEARSGWQLVNISQGRLDKLDSEEDQTAFANALDAFSSRIWRKPRSRKRYRYDLAMLVDLKEKLPPSDRTALANFVRAGKQLGINVQMIGKGDYHRLAEYDGLFIRETTSVEDHTYRFARKAESLGLVVIDDPTSILRCTNKVYLADLLRTHHIPTPKTVILSDGSRETQEQLIADMGLPLVLKIPDGSFSRGVVKAKTEEELGRELHQLRQHSALVLAQEFLYTDYDWRIGILNNKPLFACRYYMVHDHWQIYNHSGKGEPESGGYDTLPTYEVPREVLDIALKATRLIGDGLYGVDIKQCGKRVVIIEVNDNPSIDSEVEDQHLGAALYHEVMAEFLRRMENQRRPA